MTQQLDRSQAKTVRILRMISLLADHPTEGTTAINKRFSRRHGQVCVRTTARDLAALKADFTRHFRGNGSMQVKRTVRNYNDSDRMQAKLLRLLRMIALLPDRPVSLGWIRQQTNLLTGTAWCARTIRRDLGVLKGIGLVLESESGFTLNKNANHRLVTVANEIFKRGRSSE